MSITRQVSRRALILQPSDAEVSTNQVYAARYEWRVDGELSIPSPTVIDSLKHTDASFSIYRVDVSVNIGGTSQYQILIKSYDTAGLNPVIHVDEYITLTGNKNRISVAVLNAAVDQNRSLELTLLENSAAVAASDMTVTLIAEDFADMTPARDGHRVLNAAAVVQAQRPDLQFKGANVIDDSINNRTIVDMGFIGQYLESDLTLAQHQTLYGVGWVLADGVTSCVGTTYGSVTGRLVVPDARSMVLRGKNHSRADAFADPDGDKALGTETQDKFETHTHIQNAHSHVLTVHSSGAGPRALSGSATQLNSTNTEPATATNQNTGSNETAPKTLTVNIFIKIN